MHASNNGRISIVLLLLSHPLIQLNCANIFNTSIYEISLQIFNAIYNFN